MKTIIIGTRGSELAMKQTKLVEEELLKVYPELHIEVKIIKTEGDKNMKAIPLDTVGKGWFTKEIEEELLAGSIHLAVHSLKDLPEILPEGLGIASITQRGDVRDALVCPNGKLLQELPKGAVVGTDSIRRQIQILAINPGVVVRSVRGNVNTRIEKLQKGSYDALVLAAAGLERLGMDDMITQYFDPATFIPAPGQGALAIETRLDEKGLNEMLLQIRHEETCIAVEAERAFARSIGGGCKFPIGSFVQCRGRSVYIYGLLGSLDGTEIIRDEIEGKKEDAVALGEALAYRMVDLIAIEQS